MGVNYADITYNTAYPTPPAIEINDADSDIVVDGLDVDLSILGPSGWIPTHYKLWNINGVTTSGDASWESYQARVSGTLINQSGKQYVYGYFKDATHESDLVTSNGVTFSWTDPTIHETTDWKYTWSILNFGSTSSATLRNATYNTEIELNKNNIPNLRFSGRNFSDLKIYENVIEGSSSSYLGSLLSSNASAKVGITKVFDTDETPLVWVDVDGDGTRITLTQYDGSEKSGLGGDYSGRVLNYSWNSGTKTLSFDVTQFSQYGFCTIDKVEFTADSTQGSYNGSSITIKVKVTDTNGEDVEDAPVTISKVSGATIGNFSSNPVNTGADGIASFTLNLTSVGVCVFDAYVDSVHTDDDQTTWCIEANADIGRSLLRQYEQIRRLATYDDAVANINTSAVAEPTVVSGSETRLEHDLNVVRSLMLQLKGGSNWYDDPGKYFDPADTDAGNTANKQMSLANIKGKTTDSQTVLLAVSDDNSGAGFTVSGTDTGVLASITTSYATPADRRGIPIFESVTNSGTYYDEASSDDVCVVDLIDTSTGAEFENASGYIVYGKFHDGADFAGAGTGTDVYVRFYANNAPYTFTGSDPTNISIVYPHRKVMDAINEWEWTRTDFVSSWEGDVELTEDISNLWSFTGAGDNVTSPTWTNTTGNYPLSGDPSDLEAAINALNDEIDDMSFTEDNYIADGDTVADALDKLDQALKDVSDSVLAGVEEVYVEELSSDIVAGILHQLPAGVVYTPDSTSGQEGSNMDVFLDGQLLAASSGAAGVDENRDYAETTSSGITFHINVYQNSNVTYRVRE